MTHRIEFTDAQKDEIVRQYRAGVGAAVIGREFGCGNNPVMRVVHERGAHEPGRRFRGRYTTEQKQQMCERYTAGESLNAIAIAYGCTVGNVKQILQRRGVDRRPWGSPPPDRALVEEACRLRSEEGLSQQAIATRLQVTQSRVAHWLRREGFRQDPLRREAHGMWKGGRYVTPQGYCYVLVEADDQMHGMANYMGYVMEHRLLMARSLGRPLTRRETVHHVNGDRSDNRLENLQLRNGNHGVGIRLACLDCGSHNVGPVPLD